MKEAGKENLRGANFLKIQTAGQLRPRIRGIAKGCSFRSHLPETLSKMETEAQRGTNLDG